MNNSEHDFCRIPIWYPSLANHTFVTSFLRLRDDEIAALQQGETDTPVARGAVRRLREPMRTFPGNSFVSVDCVAPTDTERFTGKRGAVYSARSAWHYLAASAKVRHSAAAGEVEYICIRPFRRMNQTREFRLFIHDRQLKGMSQYWLVRHFRRLEGHKKHFWNRAEALVKEIAWVLPVENLVMDVYFTSGDEILIIDFNPWGDPTRPLLFDRWDRDWSQVAGIKLIPPPLTIRGDINVSF
ncbi:MAG: hypothetical protein PHQ27_07390 [Victivallales bacterium]|nr:hypothetical protein [Victivallales bacterium]